MKKTAAKTTAAKTTTGLLVLALAGLLGACEAPPSADEGAENTGSAQLQIAPGVSLPSVSYTITGPSAFAKTGTLSLQTSSTLSVVIGPLPAGTGFVITISGTTSNLAACSGSAAFDVVAHATTPVVVHVTCDEPRATSTVLINGSLNVCPEIDDLTASPNGLSPGMTQLHVTAHDGDAARLPLAYQWSAPSGSFSDAAATNPIFTCAGGGPLQVTVSITDGDAGCATTASVEIFCVHP